MIRLLLALVLTAPAMAQDAPDLAAQEEPYVLQSLDAELDRLQTATALLVPSQAVDEFLVWSPDGSRLAANVDGSWYTVRLDSLALGEATWRGDLSLGVLRSGESVAEAPQAASWQEAANFAPRSIKTGRGTVVELRQEGMSTAFTVSAAGVASEPLWTSEFENCHSLTLSPDERFVAFICEMNGVFVYRLSAEEEG